MFTGSKKLQRGSSGQLSHKLLPDIGQVPDGSAEFPERTHTAGYSSGEFPLTAGSATGTPLDFPTGHRQSSEVSNVELPCEERPVLLGSTGSVKSDDGAGAVKVKKPRAKESQKPKKQDNMEVIDNSVFESAAFPQIGEPASESVEKLDVEKSEKEAWRKLVAESWAEVKNIEAGVNKPAQDSAAASDDAAANIAAMAGAHKPEKEKKSGWSFWGKKDDKDGKGGNQHQHAEEKGNAKSSNGNGSSFDIPRTFKEMCLLNATMVSANVDFIKIIEECFERVIETTVKGDDGRLELEVNVIAMRIHKDVKGEFRVKDFKVCMLASLRSLIPKSWSISHEHAWTSLWDRVEEILAQNMALPAQYEKAVGKLMAEMDDEKLNKFGLNAFNRLFHLQPRAEDYFNTSNSRLSMLASKALEMAMQMYKDPTVLVNQATALGLRHIMYNISTSFFESFVAAIVEELAEWTSDQTAIEGIEWSLTQIACIMVYTIENGSNPLLQAVIANSPKAVRKALSASARKDRADYAL